MKTPEGLLAEFKVWWGEMVREGRVAPMEGSEWLTVRCFAGWLLQRWKLKRKRPPDGKGE